MLDDIEFDDGFAMVETTPPPRVVGLTTLPADDVIIVSGLIRDVEAFSSLS